VFDRKHTAEVTVVASKDKFEKGLQQFHTSCNRWRRSQLPLASTSRVESERWPELVQIVFLLHSHSDVGGKGKTAQK
jgi:hypothetical protein